MRERTMLAQLKQRKERVTTTFRIPREARDLIDQAAALLQMDRTQFVIQAATERAEQVLLNKRVFVWPEEAFEQVLALIETAPAPTERAVRAMQAQKKWKTVR